MHVPSRLALAAALTSALPAAAQTGPFQAGDLLVRARDPATNEQTLWRIDPATGQGAALATELYEAYSKAGWMAYDPWREGVLAFSSWKPVATFMPRLWLARADGSLTELGFASQSDLFTDLAPVGDGRVYLRRGGELHLLDAANELHPVLDHQGQPVTAPVEHLVYHAPTNALVGAMNVLATSPCSGVWLVTAHRLPLTADGTALAGPIACSSYDHGSAGAPIGIDPLPDGGLLLTMTDGYASSDDELLRIDPFTLAITKWAEPDFDDIDGGVWSPALGRAIILDDHNNLLRAYAQGESGQGTVVPVSVPVGDGFTGWSSANKLSDVEHFGPGCPGSVASFGQGLAGKGGKVPLLGAGACPLPGAPLPLYLSSGVGQGTGLLAFSLASAPYPLLGGTGYLLPPLVLSLVLPLDGTSGAAGDGWGKVVLPVPADPALSGTPVYGQGAVIDAAAPAGVSLTAGLELVFG